MENPQIHIHPAYTVIPVNHSGGNMKIDDATIEQLDASELLLVEQISDIQSQISKAKAKAFHLKEYSDPKWFHNIQKSLSIKKTQRALIQKRRSTLRKLAETPNFYQLFYIIAQKKLKPGTFETLKQLAQQEIDALLDLQNAELKP